MNVRISNNSYSFSLKVFFQEPNFKNLSYVSELPNYVSELPNYVSELPMYLNTLTQI